MSSRVIAAEVKELISTDRSDSEIESNFIDTANLLVTEQLEGQGLSDAMLKKLELYLAAHFLAITEEEGALVRDSFGDGSMTLANVYGAGLKMTRFGLQAIALDTTGILAKLSTNKLRAEFKVV